MTGLTAYHGIIDIGEVKEKDIVLVSSAAGSVGTTINNNNNNSNILNINNYYNGGYVVGQIAKIKGATVIGMVGSDEKVSFLKNKLSFDYAINYKKSSNLQYVFHSFTLLSPSLPLPLSPSSLLSLSLIFLSSP